MLVDEDRKYLLTKIRKAKNGIVKKESDHNVLLAEFNNIVIEHNKAKHEIYNIKNIECQQKFKQYTSNTKMLSSIFDSCDDVNLLTQRCMKKLDGCIAMCFKQIRVSDRKESEQDRLHNRMIMLKNKTDHKSRADLEKVVEDIAKNPEKKYQQLMQELNNMKPGGGK